MLNRLIDFFMEYGYPHLDFPYNLLLPILLLCFVCGALLLYKYKKERVELFFYKHLKTSLTILCGVSIIIIFCIIIVFIDDNYYFPEPPEDRLVVAISPFVTYIEDKPRVGYETASDFKKKIENQSLGIEAKFMDIKEPIEDINGAKTFGKDNGAHLVVYGSVELTEADTEQTTYKILPLESLEIKQSIENDPYFQDKLTGKIKYYNTDKKAITLIQTLGENASSVVNTIAAFEKYQHLQFQQAIKLFESIKGYQEDATILLYVGNCYYFEKKHNESLQLYDKAIELDPQDADAWNNKGVALRELGRYEEATQAYDKAIELDPQDAVAWNNKGVALHVMGRYEEATQAYDKAIELDPQDADAWDNKGYSLHEMGRYEEATQAYDKAIELDPQNADAWDNKGYSLHEMGRYEEATQAYDKAIELDPQNADAWNNKGYSLHEMGRYEEAIQAYDKAIELDPQDADAWNNKGSALHEMGRYEEAIQLYDKAIELDPKDAVAWYNKGVALHKMGRYEEAIRAYDKAIELDPQDTDAWVSKGIILKQLGRTTEAQACYDKAKELGYTE